VGENNRIIPLKSFFSEHPLWAGLILIALNFAIRVIVYYSTELFRFSDYAIYMGAVDKLGRGESQFLLEGNYLFLISSIGHFFQEQMGSLSFFFLFNCLLGSLTSLLLYFLIVKVTQLQLAGLVAVVLHTLYTEYMVFSSVFYTPVIMIFLVTAFLWLLYLYTAGNSPGNIVFHLLGLVVVYMLTFFFKPELKYLPWFLMGLSGIFFLRRNMWYKRTVLLAAVLIAGNIALGLSGIITSPPGNVISNSFVFFGHTGYGGDGGEGAFIYDSNRDKYEKELDAYLLANDISSPTAADYNSFQKGEIVKYIKTQPFHWAALQFKKFFRTFGVAPESTTFKILYTGALKGRMVATLGFTVIPVVLIVLLLILLFNGKTTKRLFMSRINSREEGAGLFYIIWLLMFVYYLIATIFYGQYQERYRMPLMVMFIIPALAVFIATFERGFFKVGREMVIKSVIVALFAVSWGSQVLHAIGNTERFEKGIEKLENINGGKGY